MVSYKQKHDNLAVKKTLTIPQWLNTMAEREGLNFSNILLGCIERKVRDMAPVKVKRDSSGNIASEVAGVYLQLGGSRNIYFSNGTTVANQHLSTTIP